MPKWGFFALSIQLVLVFFAPPIALASKQIFLSDLWMLVWVAFASILIIKQFCTASQASLEPAPQAPHSFFVFFICTGLLLVLVYAHGYFRPDLESLFNPHGFYLVKNELKTEAAHFQPLREFIHCVRYFSWILAAWITFHWFCYPLSKTNVIIFKKLQKILLVCLALSGSFSILAKLSPTIKKILGQIYNYNPNYEYWADRIYGVFSSPVEASACFLFGFVLFYSSPFASPFNKVLACVFTFLGARLAHTFFPFFGLLVALGIPMWVKLSKKHKALTLSISVLLMTNIFFLYKSVFLAKLENLHSRWIGWKVYLDALFSRLDFLLLGFGFIPIHSDNSYFFLLSRGGVLLFLCCMGWMLLKLKTYWKYWPLKTSMILVYLLVTGLGLDILIFRHVVVLLVTIAIPLLALKYSKRSPV